MYVSLACRFFLCLLNFLPRDLDVWWDYTEKNLPRRNHPNCCWYPLYVYKTVCKKIFQTIFYRDDRCVGRPPVDGHDMSLRNKLIIFFIFRLFQPSMSLVPIKLLYNNNFHFFVQKFIKPSFKKDCNRDLALPFWDSFQNKPTFIFSIMPIFCKSINYKIFRHPAYFLGYRIRIKQQLNCYGVQNNLITYNGSMVVCESMHNLMTRLLLSNKYSLFYNSHWPFGAKMSYRFYVRKHFMQKSLHRCVFALQYPLFYSSFDVGKRAST